MNLKFHFSHCYIPFLPLNPPKFLHAGPLTFSEQLSIHKGHMNDLGDYVVLALA